GQIQGNTSENPKLREGDKQDEMSTWNGIAGRMHATYDGIISNVNQAAKTTRTTLESLASNINGKKVPAAASTHDIDLALEGSLPLLHQQVATDDANTVAGLLPKAANGDPSALAAIQQYAGEASDPYFATAFMNKLGPQGLLQLPGIMTDHLKD